MPDKATIVVLSGDFDVRRRDELDQILDRYGDADPLVLDVSAVHDFDGPALHALVRFHHARIQAGKGQVTVVGASERIRTLLEQAELDRMFELRDVS